MPASPAAPMTYGATPGPFFVFAGGGVASVAASGTLVELEALDESFRAEVPASGGGVSSPSERRGRFASMASESGERFSAPDALSATFAAVELSVATRPAF